MIGSGLRISVPHYMIGRDPRSSTPMWTLIGRSASLLVIVVCLCWIVEHPDARGAALFQFPRLAQPRDKGEFYTQLGTAAVERGDYHRAVRLLTTAISKGGLAEAFKYRAQAYEGLGRQEEASADVDRYIRMKPRDPWGYSKRGTWHSLESRHLKAVAQFHKALKLDPSFVETHFGLGIAYVALERPESAVHEFQKVLDLEPENQDALLNLGVALMLSGRSTEARTTLNKALQVQEDPKWKGRLEQWIASLPSTDETKGPSAIRSTGQLDGTDPVSNSVENSGSRSSRYDPVPDENNQAGFDRRKEQDMISAKEPEAYEVGRHPSPDSEPTKSQKASPKQGPMVLTGKWNTEYRGIEIGVTIRQVGNAISGVMNVGGPLIGRRSFPFNGTFGGGVLKGRSLEGHAFQGRVYRTGKVIGEFKIKGGPTIPVSFFVGPEQGQLKSSGK